MQKTDLKVLARTAYTIGGGEEHDAILHAVEEIKTLRALVGETGKTTLNVEEIAKILGAEEVIPVSSPGHAMQLYLERRGKGRGEK